MNRYELAISRGAVPGLSTMLKFGQNSDVDLAADEDIWDGGGTWAAPTAARVHAMVSDSAADAAAGTGARTVTVYGLDANYVLQSETVTLNGVTPVNTANSYTMIHRMLVATAGSGAANAGTITATAATDSTVTAQIGVGNNQTLMAIYQIPDGYTGYMTSWYSSVNGGASAFAVTAKLFIKPFGGVFNLKSILGLAAQGVSYIRYPYDLPLVCAEKSIVKISAASTANNAVVSGGFDIVLMES